MLIHKHMEKRLIVINKSAKWHCGRHTLICKKNSN